MKSKEQRGITLVALVITVIVTLILAGVGISLITGENGLFTKANHAASLYNDKSQNEAERISDLMSQMDSALGNDVSGANAPILLTGMKAVIFNADGTTKEVQAGEEWYNYTKKKWANAETEDGSLWVWIPRFAYQITYNDNNDRSKGGKIDVVFLKNKTNEYVVNGKTQIASNTLNPSTYTLHPSFKKAVNADYSHGEWDKELTGYWVAKFQAGWQEGNALAGTNGIASNDKTRAVESNITFKNPNNNRYLINLDGDNNNSNDKITYPVFKGATYVMNYMSQGDMFAISRNLTTSGNIYGLASDADSHMMKNSEWGACAYLGYSQYGTDGSKVYRNNVNLNDGTNYVYGVTGYTNNTPSDDAVNLLSGANIWYTSNGQKGSNNYNITGVYDMSGCTWERVASYIANGNTHLADYGQVDITDKLIATTSTSNDTTTLSTKYSTLYRSDTSDTEIENYNANKNAGMYGDAIVETSNVITNGYSNTSWDGNASHFACGNGPFFARGGGYDGKNNTAGSFAYNDAWGDQGYNSTGFRVVLCPIN